MPSPYEFRKVAKSALLLALVLNLPARCPRNALSWLLTSPHLAALALPSLSPLLAFADDGSSQQPPPSLCWNGESGTERERKEEYNEERYTAAADDDDRRGD